MLGEEFHRIGCRTIHEAEAYGTIGNLRSRLLARGVEDATATNSDPCGCLEEECALTDSWLTAEKYDRSRDNAAAKDSVKLGNAQWNAWCPLASGGAQGAWWELPTCAAHCETGAWASRWLLDRLNERLPLAAVAAGLLKRWKLEGAALAEPDISLFLRHRGRAPTQSAAPTGSAGAARLAEPAGS
jgi:hypothetical protein